MREGGLPVTARSLLAWRAMNVRFPSRVRARVVALGVLVCLPSQVLAAPASARKTSTARKPPAAKADFASVFASAVSRYENFDYEHALEGFNKAKALAMGTEQEVPVSLYLGIVQAELGNREQCLAAFRTALYLQPDATLPVKVSPRVQGDFEDVRKAVMHDLGITPAPVAATTPPAVTPSATTTPVAATTPPAADLPVASPADKTPDLTAPARAPAQAAYMPELRAEQPRRNNTLPLVLLGTAAVTGGAALFFGLQSRSDVTAAYSDTFYDARTQHLAAAQKRALVSNVLIGTASAAALLGALTYFFMPGSTSAPAPAASGGASP